MRKLLNFAKKSAGGNLHCKSCGKMHKSSHVHFNSMIKRRKKSVKAEEAGESKAHEARESKEFERGEKEEEKEGKRHKKFWIQEAIKKPGALRRSLGAKEGRKIPARKLQAASKKGGKIGQRARLARTLASFRK